MPRVQSVVHHPAAYRLYPVADLTVRNTLTRQGVTMADTNAASTNSIVDKVVQNPHIANFWDRTSALEHIGIIFGFAIAAHLIVKLIRHFTEWFLTKKQEK